MNKNRSHRITLFSIVYAFLGVTFLVVAIYPVLLWLTNAPELAEYVGDEISFSDAKYIYATMSIPAILLIISSILLFNLNPWGYRLALLSLILQILPLGLLGILIIIFAVVHIIYFNRNNVIDQFKIKTS